MTNEISKFLKSLRTQKPEPKSNLDVIIDYLSVNRLKPSRDFTGDQYAIFLEIAKPYELETDTISSETYKQVCTETNTIPQKPEFPPGRKIYQ
jgi:hypothetical protein